MRSAPDGSDATACRYTRTARRAWQGDEGKYGVDQGGASVAAPIRGVYEEEAAVPRAVLLPLRQNATRRNFLWSYAPGLALI